MLDHIRELKISDKVILNGKERKIITSEKGYKFIYEDSERIYLHKLIAAHKYAIPMKSIDRYDILFKDNNKSNLSYDNIEVRLKDFIYDGRYLIKNIPYKTNEYIPKEVMNKLIKEGFLKEIPDSKYKTYIGKNGVVVKRNGQIRALDVSSDGYLRLEYVTKNGKVKKQLHRLVAQLFIPPYTYNNGDKVINHKDGNPKNNHANNLEWVSQKENIIHSHKNGFVKRDFRIILEDLKTGKKKEFYSLRYLGRELKTGIGGSVDKLSTIIRVTEKYPLYGRYRFDMVNKELLTDTEGDVYIIVKNNNKVTEFKTLNRLCYYYGIPIKTIRNIIVTYKRPRIVKFKDVEIEFTKYLRDVTVERKDIELMKINYLKEKENLETLIKKQALEEVLKI